MSSTSARYFVQASRRDGQYVQSQGYVTYQEAARIAADWKGDASLIGVNIRFADAIRTVAGGAWF